MLPRLLIITLSCALAAPVLGKEAAPIATDPVLERRLTKLTEELRCLVCQNQSLADSHADLAIDLKNQVREKLQQGMSEKEVIDYMVARYGDFVLYRPPVKNTTYFLWFGPGLLLAGGLAALYFRLVRRRREIPADTPLSDAERARAQVLLGDTEK